MPIILHYDGKWTDFPGDTRQWTVRSHFIDENGQDRFGGSFSRQSLLELLKKAA